MRKEAGLSCRADRCFTVQQPISCAASGCHRLPDVPADETVEDPDGQLKMLSADVADLARRMNEEIEDIEESGE